MSRPSEEQVCHPTTLTNAPSERRHATHCDRSTPIACEAASCEAENRRDRTAHDVNESVIRSSLR